MKIFLQDLQDLSAKELVDFIVNEDIKNPKTREDKYTLLLKEILKLIDLSNQFKMANTPKEEDVVLNRIIEGLKDGQKIFVDFCSTGRKAKQDTLNAFLFAQNLLKPADAYFFDDSLYAHFVSSCLNRNEFVNGIEVLELESFIMEFYDDLRLSKQIMIYPYSNHSNLKISNELLDHFINNISSRYNPNFVSKLLEQDFDSDYLEDSLEVAIENKDYKRATFLFRLLNYNYEVREFSLPVNATTDFRAEFLVLQRIEMGYPHLDYFVDLLLVEELADIYLENNMEFNEWYPKLEELTAQLFHKIKEDGNEVSHFRKVHSLLQLKTPDIVVPNFHMYWTTEGLPFELLELYYNGDSIYNHLMDLNTFYLFDKVNKTHKQALSKEDSKAYRSLLQTIPSKKDNMNIHEIMTFLETRSMFEFGALIERIVDKKGNEPFDKLVQTFQLLNKCHMVNVLKQKYDVSDDITAMLNFSFYQIVEEIKSAVVYLNSFNPYYTRLFSGYLIDCFYFKLLDEQRLDSFKENVAELFADLLNAEDWDSLSNKYFEGIELLKR